MECEIAVAIGIIKGKR